MEIHRSSLVLFGYAEIVFLAMKRRAKDLFSSSRNLRLTSEGVETYTESKQTAIE